MSNEIFSTQSNLFLENTMNICLVDLNKKIISDSPTKLKFFNYLIEFIIRLKPKLEYKEELSHSNNSDNMEFLNKKLLGFIMKYNIEESSKEYFIFDNLRHAFINYSQDGVYGMYKHREDEGWYPKIIINKNIGTRNDINSLDTEVVIYRGTSEDEYNSKIFGQSWTIDEHIAKEFAFIHYSRQEDYNDTVRVVVKAKINKDNIYYFDKDDQEKEVIVNESQIIISSIELINKKVLNYRIKA